MCQKKVNRENFNTLVPLLWKVKNITKAFNSFLSVEVNDLNNFKNHKQWLEGPVSAEFFLVAIIVTIAMMSENIKTKRSMC